MTFYLRGNVIEELAFFRKLTAAGKRLGLSVFVFTPEDVDDSSRQIRAWVYDEAEGRWLRKRASFPDIVYDRCRYQRTYRFQLLRKFRTRYPNLLYMSRPLVHKWGMHQLLHKNKKIRPYLPETVSYRSSSDLTAFLSRHGVVYLKPIDGTGGRGILRIENLGDGQCLIQGRNRDRKIIAPQKIRIDQISARLSSWNLKKRYLIQQGIHLKLKDGRVHDYRLLIQKNGSGAWEVTGCAGRIGAKRSITSNLHGGGLAVTFEKLLRHRFGSESKIAEIRQTMDELAHQVVRHVERQFGSMCEMALDIAVDGSGHVWLLEINPKPAREVFHRIGEQETYRKAVVRPAEYALYLYRNGEGDVHTSKLR